MPGRAFVLVRSVVANPDDREPFDRWYQADHIPLRSRDPLFAVRFPNMSKFEKAARSEGYKYIVADYAAARP